MADFASVKDSSTPSAAAAAAAFGYQFLFFKDKDGEVSYWRWKLGSDDNEDARKLRVGGKKPYKVGVAGINVVTYQGQLLVYLVNSENYIFELGLSGLEQKWWDDSLFTKKQCQIAPGSIVSAIDNPLQVFFTREGHTKYLSVAYWVPVQNKWEVVPLENLKQS